MIVRKKAILHIGLCPHHRDQRRHTRMSGWMGAWSGRVVGFAALAFNSNVAVFLGVTGFLVFIASAIYGGLRGPMISAAKVTNENVWVKGVHRDFMANLPEWTGND